MIKYDATSASIAMVIKRRMNKQVQRKGRYQAERALPPLAHCQLEITETTVRKKARIIEIAHITRLISLKYRLSHKVNNLARSVHKGCDGENEEA